MKDILGHYTPLYHLSSAPPNWGRFKVTMEEFNKEEAMKRKAEINYRLNNKLVAPNDNYEVVNCLVCKKEFIRRITKGTKKLAVGIRGRLSKNCSRICTKKYKRNPKAVNAENASPCIKSTSKKPEVVILDDNELSMACYAKEYPENFKEISSAVQNASEVEDE